MRFLIKLITSVCIIVIASQVGRKFPSLAGLVAVMPLTSLIVLLWLYQENPQNVRQMTDYTKGALLGIGPTVLFFLAAFLCFRRQMPLWMVLTISFAVWLVGAAVWHLLVGSRQ